MGTKRRRRQSNFYTNTPVKQAELEENKRNSKNKEKRRKTNICESESQSKGGPLEIPKPNKK